MSTQSLEDAFSDAPDEGQEEGQTTDAPRFDEQDPHATLTADQQDRYDAVFGDATAGDASGDSDFLSELEPDLANKLREAGVKDMAGLAKRFVDGQTHIGEQSQRISDMRERTRELDELKGQVAALQAGQQASSPQNGGEPSRDDLLGVDLPRHYQQQIKEINDEAQNAADADPDRAVATLATALARTQSLLPEMLSAQQEQSELRMQARVEELHETQTGPIMQRMQKAELQRSFEQQATIYGPAMEEALRPEAQRQLAEWRQQNPDIIRDPRVIDLAYKTAYADRQMAEQRQRASEQQAQTLSGGSAAPRPATKSEADDAWDDVETLMKSGSLQGGL